jgi:cytidylate kinase
LKRVFVLDQQGIDAVAIDGPAASGKTTIGYMLANSINYLFLDTGCMYRAVTLAALVKGIEIEDEPAVVELTRGLELGIVPANERDNSDGRLYTVLIDGNDVTWDIRSNDVDLNVSQVSAYEGVRKNLVLRQRAIGLQGRVVMVGRDIGTVVLPDAPLKLYIIASPEERAKRRWQELESRDHNFDYSQILADIRRRDRFDGHRVHSPMEPAKDAIIIDSTSRKPEEVLRTILELDYFAHKAA